jgi:hypothetical protein
LIRISEFDKLNRGILLYWLCQQEVEAINTQIKTPLFYIRVLQRSVGWHGKLQKNAISAPSRLRLISQPVHPMKKMKN